MRRGDPVFVNFLGSHGVGFGAKLEDRAESRACDEDGAAGVVA